MLDTLTHAAPIAAVPHTVLYQVYAKLDGEWDTSGPHTDTLSAYNDFLMCAEDSLDILALCITPATGEVRDVTSVYMKEARCSIEPEQWPLGVVGTDGAQAEVLADIEAGKRHEQDERRALGVI